MRNGNASQRAPWAALNVVSGCSLWPTPLASDAKRVSEFSIKTLAGASSNKSGSWAGYPALSEAVAEEFGLYQSADFTEWLMGLPPGWTRID